MNTLTQTQQGLVERTEKSLAYRLEGLRSAIQQIGVVGGDLTAQASQLEVQLASVHSGEVSQLAVRSLNAQGASSWMVVSAGTLAGLVLAILAAFGSYFAFSVRQRLA